MDMLIYSDLIAGIKGRIEVERRIDNKTALKLYQKIKEKFDTGMLELLEQYIDIISEIYNEESNLYLIEGFKLGLKIGIDLQSLPAKIT